MRFEKHFVNCSPACECQVPPSSTLSPSSSSLTSSHFLQHLGHCLKHICEIKWFGYKKTLQNIIGRNNSLKKCANGFYTYLRMVNWALWVTHSSEFWIPFQQPQSFWSQNTVSWEPEIIAVATYTSFSTSVKQRESRSLVLIFFHRGRILRA